MYISSLAAIRTLKLWKLRTKDMQELNSVQVSVLIVHRPESCIVRGPLSKASLYSSSVVLFVSPTAPPWLRTSGAVWPMPGVIFTMCSLPKVRRTFVSEKAAVLGYGYVYFEM